MTSIGVSGGGKYRPSQLSAWRNKLKQARERRIEAFAEHLADGLSITEASHRLGVTQQAGSAMLATIRARLGPQAR